MVAVEGVMCPCPTEAIDGEMKTGAIEVLTGIYGTLLICLLVGKS